MPTMNLLSKRTKENAAELIKRAQSEESKT
jgi:hypothetical protein